jgi:hypothetical protein
MRANAKNPWWLWPLLVVVAILVICSGLYVFRTCSTKDIITDAMYGVIGYWVYGVGEAIKAKK